MLEGIRTLVLKREFRYLVEMGCSPQEWVFRVRPWGPPDGLPMRAHTGDVSLVGELFDVTGELLKDRAGNPILVYGNTESALRFQAEEKLRRLFLQEPRPAKVKCICA